VVLRFEVENIRRLHLLRFSTDFRDGTSVPVIPTSRHCANAEDAETRTNAMNCVEKVVFMISPHQKVFSENDVHGNVLSAIVSCI
jgi:hypothetical protein